MQLDPSLASLRGRASDESFGAGFRNPCRSSLFRVLQIGLIEAADRTNLATRPFTRARH